MLPTTRRPARRARLAAARPGDRITFRTGRPFRRTTVTGVLWAITADGIRISGPRGHARDFTLPTATTIRLEATV